MHNSQFTIHNSGRAKRRELSFRLCALSIVHCALVLQAVEARQLLDRVVAVVGTRPIMQTDVDAAIGLGIVDLSAGEEPRAAATRQLVERELALAEVSRFAPPEPVPGDVEGEVAAMRAHAGGGLESLFASTGLDDARIRDLARDTLRIRAYLDQRFGATVQVTDDDVTRYYRLNPAVFTRDGVLRPFTEVEPEARERAAAARRAAVVAQWLRDLRSRGAVTIPPARPGESPTR